MERKKNGKAKKESDSKERRERERGKKERERGKKERREKEKSINNRIVLALNQKRANLVMMMKYIDRVMWKREKRG